MGRAPKRAGENVGPGRYSNNASLKSLSHIYFKEKHPETHTPNCTCIEIIEFQTSKVGLDRGNCPGNVVDVSEDTTRSHLLGRHVLVYVDRDISVYWNNSSGRTLLSWGGTNDDDQASGSSPKIVGLTTEVIDFACFERSMVRNSRSLRTNKNVFGI